MADKVIIQKQILTSDRHNFEIELLYPITLKLQEDVQFPLKGVKKYYSYAHFGPDLGFFVQGNDVLELHNDFIYMVFNTASSLKSLPWDECFGSVYQYNAFKKYVRIA